MEASTRKAKIERIKELRRMGFNTPRMFYVPPYGVYDLYNDIKRWLNREKKRAKQFNIRTYLWKNSKEKLNCPHLVGLSADEVVERLLELKDYECMIDAESGSIDGQFAGTLEIDWDNARWVLDYCDRPGAMVRLADKTASGCLGVPTPSPEQVGVVLSEIGARWPYSRRKGVVQYEFSIHKEPCGEKQRRLIFWEYRVVE